MIYYRINYDQLNKLKSPSFAIKKMITAATLKIFINYSQTITIINGLKFDWDVLLLNTLNLYKASAGSLQEVVSFECFFTGYRHHLFYFYI